MSVETTVFIVDDNQDARESVSALVQSMGVRALTYPSAEAFLADFDETQSGCLVSDMRMLGMSGTELLEILRRAGHQLPMILVSGYITVSGVVQAMKTGAVNVLKKPYEQTELWDAISAAITQNTVDRTDQAYHKAIADRFGLLSEPERQVLDFVSQGLANKVTARKLGVSVRTVEDRRRNVYKKLGVDSVASLIRLVMEQKQNETATHRAFGEPHYPERLRSTDTPAAY
jgi:two-component system response regulator FixJ